MHPLAADIASGVAKDLKRLGILEKIDPDLLQNGLGIGLDDLRRFVAQDVDRRDLAGDVGRCLLYTSDAADE